MPDIRFSRASNDLQGLMVAVIGTDGYVAVPQRNGTISVGLVSNGSSPIETWTREHIWTTGETGLANEDAFRNHMHKIHRHKNEVLAFGRRQIAGGASTPWGTADYATQYAEGIISYGTPGHGGFWLSDDRVTQMNSTLRKGIWYEEDSDWARVALAFPDYFSAYERELAEKTLLQWQPAIWSAFTGKAVLPGMSHIHDKALFEHKHAADWIVISAIRSDTYAGMVECIAAVGGRRENSKKRTYLVPTVEYQARSPHGFVIDEVLHEQIERKAH